MTVTLSFDATCPSCGGPIKEVTPAVLIHNRDGVGTETKAVYRCAVSPQHGDFAVVVNLIRIRVKGENACGTPAGYDRHCHRHETPCPACRDAYQRYHNPTQTVAKGSPGWEEKTIARRRAREELLTHA